MQEVSDIKDKIKNWIRSVRLALGLENNFDYTESILILGITFLWNQLVYLGARWIAQSWHHYDMTTAFDRVVPFLPWTVSIYFGCYLFWGLNYFLCTVQSTAERDRFFCTDALAKGICFFFFLMIPTTNVRPEIVGGTIWDSLMKLLYQIDAADNLFPSIHCLVSWLCWIGVRNRKDISMIYRYFSLAAAIVVCISTLTTRQHVIADVAGGVLLAEICYYAAGHDKVCKVYSATISLIKRKFSK